MTDYVSRADPKVHAEVDPGVVIQPTGYFVGTFAHAKEEKPEFVTATFVLPEGQHLTLIFTPQGASNLAWAMTDTVAKQFEGVKNGH